MAGANAIVAAARSWLGVPFVHAGRDEHGIDCMGLIALVAKECGFSVYDTRDYNLGDGALMEKVLTEHMDAVPLEEATLGDVVVFSQHGRMQHVGILTGDDLMVHCNWSGRKRCMEHHIGRYRVRLTHAFRYRR